MSHIDEFRAAIISAGLTPPETIYDDGKRRRFPSNGNKRDDSGWYILHGDDRPAGAFGCWRSQISVTWKHSEKKRFTAEERAAWKKRMQEIEAERAEEQRIERETAAAEAADCWGRAAEGEHPYLARKQIACLGARVLDGQLLIPMRHGPGALVGLQRIFASGDKRFVKGTPLEGAYHVIGRPNKTGRIIICEGYATAASIHMATDLCVVVAFNAGNLIHVARKIRAAMPSADIVLAADDDAWTVYPQNHPKAGQPWNPGIEAAEAVALEIDGTVALPEWNGERPERHTDFNDLHVDEGLDSVRLCFNNPYKPLLPPEQGGASSKPLVAGNSASDKAGSVGAVSERPNNTVSSAAVSPFAAGAAVSEPGHPSEPAPTGEDAPASNVPPDEDIFIWASSPLNTARLFQKHLPADGKVLFWRGEFYIWNGHRYQVRDAVYLHQILYRFMSGCMTTKINPRTGDSEVVAFSPKKSHIEDVMHALRAVCFIDLPEPPTWINPEPGDPDPSDLVAFQNGFLDLKTRTLLPSTPRLFVINALEFDYTPDAPEPVEWLKFLDSLWPTDPQSIEALADAFGYMLTDDTSQQKMFMFIGPPRSGKGTILRVLESLVGTANRVSPSLAGLGTQFGLQPLVGKRVAMISDARLSGKTDQQPIVENLLRISGEDSLTIDRKYLGPWSGKLPVRFIMASNETPSFTDASGALPNRFIMFKFTQSFLGREDRGLTGRLLQELPGILRWALDGLERLRARGYLLAPESGADLADEMREQSSPISSFVADRCVVDPNASIERGDLYAAWKEWCASQGMDHPGTMASFGRRLSAAVAGVGRSQPREDGVRRNMYTGIRLREYADLDLPF